MTTEVEQLSAAIKAAESRRARLRIDVTEWRTATQHKFICATRVGRGAWRYEDFDTLAEVMQYVSTL